MADSDRDIAYAPTRSQASKSRFNLKFKLYAEARVRVKGAALPRRGWQQLGLRLGTQYIFGVDGTLHVRVLKPGER